MNFETYLEILKQLGHVGNEPTFLIIDEVHTWEKEEK